MNSVFVLVLASLACAQINAQLTTINSERCGVRKDSLDNSRIVGGAESKRGDWPWQISMHFNGRHICGGFLINNLWVVTAAHCVDSPNVNNYTIWLGLHEQNVLDEWTVERKVDQIIRHEKYSSFLIIRNDIALIKLDRVVEYNDYIRPACLRTDAVTHEGESSWATGWGYLAHDGPASKLKMELETTVQTNKDCKSRYSFRYFPSEQLCVGKAKDGQGACFGDSGGPLSIRSNDDSKWYSTGITSFLVGVCGDGAVYTRVSFYVNWILAKIAN